MQDGGNARASAHRPVVVGATSSTIQQSPNFRRWILVSPINRLMTDEERKSRWMNGEENFYIPGITDTQVRNLEMRGRSERVIRRAMRMCGESPRDIDAFVAATLPPIWDVVVKNMSR